MEFTLVWCIGPGDSACPQNANDETHPCGFESRLQLCKDCAEDLSSFLAKEDDENIMVAPEIAPASISATASSNVPVSAAVPFPSTSSSSNALVMESPGAIAHTNAPAASAPTATAPVAAPAASATTAASPLAAPAAAMAAAASAPTATAPAAAPAAAMAPAASAPTAAAPVASAPAAAMAPAASAPTAAAPVAAPAVAPLAFSDTTGADTITGRCDYPSCSALIRRCDETCCESCPWQEIVKCFCESHNVHDQHVDKFPCVFPGCISPYVTGCKECSSSGAYLFCDGHRGHDVHKDIVSLVRTIMPASSVATTVAELRKGPTDAQKISPDFCKDAKYVQKTGSDGVSNLFCEYPRNQILAYGSVMSHTHYIFANEDPNILYTRYCWAAILNYAGT